MALKYAGFIVEVLEARGLKKTDLASMIGVKPEQIYDFLEGVHEPRAGLAKAVEKALEIQSLDPSYYGWGDSKKP